MPRVITTTTMLSWCLLVTRLCIVHDGVSVLEKKCATLGFFDDLPTTILNGMDNNGIAK